MDIKYLIKSNEYNALILLDINFGCQAPVAGAWRILYIAYYLASRQLAALSSDSTEAVMMFSSMPTP